MPAAWMLLLLACCGHAKTVGEELPPADPGVHFPSDVRSVFLKGKSHTDNVEVSGPVNLTLQCTWAGDGGNVTAHWTKDGREIAGSRVTTLPLNNRRFQLKRMFIIKDEESLGRYSCMFGNEAKVDFILTVPHIGDVRDKPVVSYVGDSVVLVCKMDDNKPKPKTWLWFRANGTDKEQIDAVVEPEKYQMKNDGKATKLHVYDLTRADSVAFYCGAVFAIGTAVSHLELKVITIYEPLKPFVAIVLEVLVLVAAILLFERSRSKRGRAQEVANAEPPTTDAEPPAPSGERNGLEENPSARQRKA